jgi:hypothetical protein
MFEVVAHAGRIAVRTVAGMGMFDTIHTEQGCAQVKCFGKLLADFWIGDRVSLYQSLTADEFAEYQTLYEQIVADHAAQGLIGVDLQVAVAADDRTNPLYAGKRSELANYEVRMARDGGFVHVRDGVITGWDGSFDHTVPCVDTVGRRVAVSGVVGSVVPVHATRCDRCTDGDHPRDTNHAR